METDNRPGLQAAEVERRLLAFMQSELLSPEVTVRRDDELLSSGLLDSVGVLRLVAFLEEAFEIKIQPADFMIENFKNVAVLAEYVQRASQR